MPQATQIRRHRASLIFYLGVAPDGVYTVPVCHHTSGELLPRLFILTGRNRRLFSVALSLGLLQPDVIWYSVSLKPGLSSPLDFPFPGAAIRLPVTDRLYGQGNYCKKFVQKLKTLRKKISPFFYLNKSQARQGLGANRLPHRQNRTRTVNKILKIPIDSHIFPCYTISIGN